ncbi:MAG TPA: ABC transporter substrate-binding protein [Chloroflexota bacterium]|nr:ABC transporter substrate-binding protein [Chloroflexota bacterium]
MRGQVHPALMPMRAIFSQRMAIGLLTVAGLTLAPTASALRSQMAAHAANDSGTLVMVTDGSAGTLDPAADEQAASNNIQRNIYEPLAAARSTNLNVLTPVLATSWTTNADKSVWTFHLRHGVKFHTGREMTAKDVQYSIARTVIANLAGSYVFRRFMPDSPYNHIKIIDNYTIQFHFSQPQPFFLDATTSEYTSEIVDSVEVQKHYSHNDYGSTWLTTHDVGTGPYMLQSWQHGQQETLVKFPQYWGGWASPHFSTIIVKEVPDGATRRELLERGQADLTFDLPWQDNLALQGEGNLGIKVIPSRTFEVDYIQMTEAGPLASPLARQALSYAFNYNAMLKAGWGGFARRAYGPLPSLLLGYDPNVFKYQTDLNKARQLLQQAGVKPGTTLSLYIYNAPAYWPLAGAILKAQLQQIGLTVNIVALNPAAFTTVYYKTEPPVKHPNLLGFAWWSDYNEPWDMSDPLIDSASAGAAGANSGYYKNATVDSLLHASLTADTQTLVANFKKIQNITSQVDPPAIWIGEPEQVNVMRKNIQGFVPSAVAIQTYLFYQLHR